jgi:hypothetical protein
VTHDRLAAPAEEATAEAAEAEGLGQGRQQATAPGRQEVMPKHDPKKPPIRPKPIQPKGPLDPKPRPNPK